MSHLPTLILNHGNWHDPSCFHKISTALTSLGYKCILPEKPSTGDLAATKTLADDVQVLRTALQECLDMGEEVVAIAHSAAGNVISSAIEGLSRTARAQAGKPGGVICLAMMTCFITPVGGMFPTVTPYRGVEFDITVSPLSFPNQYSTV